MERYICIDCGRRKEIEDGEVVMLEPRCACGMYLSYRNVKDLGLAFLLKPTPGVS